MLWLLSSYFYTEIQVYEWWKNKFYQNMQNCCFFDASTDIERRSQNSHTAPCNGAVNHGAPIKSLRVFADHTNGNKCKKIAPTIFICCVAFHEYFSSCPDCNIYAPDESRLFCSQEKPEYPQLEAHARIKMVRVLGSRVFICGCKLDHDERL